MIKLKAGQIRNPEFLMATQKIYRSKMGVRSAKRVLEILRLINEELKTINENFKKMSDEHMEPDGSNYFKVKEGIEHQKAVEEFMDMTLELDKEKISVQELFHVELSPSDLDILGDLITLE